MYTIKCEKMNVSAKKMRKVRGCEFSMMMLVKDTSSEYE